jgi:hypothetical protein
MLRSVDLHLDPNEASDLVEFHEPGLLEARGWDRGFLTVLDDGPVERCVALLGHEAGAPADEGWSSHRLRFRAKGGKGRTEDAEALTVRDGRVYVAGSHFGSKDGPLQPKRQFLARFDQAASRRGSTAPGRGWRSRGRASACTGRSTTRCARRGSSPSTSRAALATSS